MYVIGIVPLDKYILLRITSTPYILYLFMHIILLYKSYYTGILAPFVLRRLKSDVLEQLVGKTTSVIKLNMTNIQQKVYDDIIIGYAKRREGIMRTSQIQAEIEAKLEVGKGGRKKKKVEVTTHTGNGTGTGDSNEVIVLDSDSSSPNENLTPEAANSSEVYDLTSPVNDEISEEPPLVRKEMAITAFESACSTTTSSTTSATATVELVTQQPSGDHTADSCTTVVVKEEVDDEAIASVIRELSPSEAKHLFTALRKVCDYHLSN